MRVLVAFDWNGTLVDDAVRATDATSAVLTRRGAAAMTLDQFRDQFRLPLSDFFRTIGVAERDLGRAESEWNRELGASPAALADGVNETLAAIASRGWDVGVVSAASSSAVLTDVARLGLASVFRFVWGDQTDKRIALEALRAEVDRLIYVGDTEYDMTCAREAGALAIGYSRGYRPAGSLRSSGAAAVIDDHRNILVALDELDVR